MPYDKATKLPRARTYSVIADQGPILPFIKRVGKELIFLLPAVRQRSLIGVNRVIMRIPLALSATLSPTIHRTLKVPGRIYNTLYRILPKQYVFLSSL